MNHVQLFLKKNNHLQQQFFLLKLLHEHFKKRKEVKNQENQEKSRKRRESREKERWRIILSSTLMIKLFHSFYLKIYLFYIHLNHENNLPSLFPFFHWKKKNWKAETQKLKLKNDSSRYFQIFRYYFLTLFFSPFPMKSLLFLSGSSLISCLDKPFALLDATTTAYTTVTRLDYLNKGGDSIIAVPIATKIKIIYNHLNSFTQQLYTWTNLAISDPTLPVGTFPKAIALVSFFSLLFFFF